MHSLSMNILRTIADMTNITIAQMLCCMSAAISILLTLTCSEDKIDYGNGVLQNILSLFLFVFVLRVGTVNN